MTKHESHFLGKCDNCNAWSNRKSRCNAIFDTGPICPREEIDSHELTKPSNFASGLTESDFNDRDDEYFNKR
jgi:hypothetical protein